MNGSDLLLTAPVAGQSPLGQTDAPKTGNIKPGPAVSADDNKTAKIARDFESVLLTKLLDEMKNTIGNGLGEEEAGSEQVKGLFWFCLAQDMSEKGGLGLWKDLNRFFKDMQKTDASAQSLDEKL
jgi:Rod binding domain-containing protein